MTKARQEYEVRFHTPAFLGDATQEARWRTPPFKALLRQWWRIRRAPEVGHDWRKLRKDEGPLFGQAGNGGEGGGAGASQVRLTLNGPDGQWPKGSLAQDGWPSFKRLNGRVYSHVYLGYGPVLPDRKRTAIQHLKQSATLTLQSRHLDESALQALHDAMQLAHWFGCMGSRSRNGWGSLSLDGEGILPHLDMHRDGLLDHVTRPWEDCLQCEWPTAIGRDEHGPLIWVSGPLKDWPGAVDWLAERLYRVRSRVKDYPEKGTAVRGVHLLGYPAGSNARMRDWDRLASPLRFKVFDDQGAVRALICHFPCKVPGALRKADPDWLNKHEERVWRSIHEALDDAKAQRSAAVWGGAR